VAGPQDDLDHNKLDGVICRVYSRICRVFSLRFAEFTLGFAEFSL
jgi:hypothetical protein